MFERDDHLFHAYKAQKCYILLLNVYVEHMEREILPGIFRKLHFKCFTGNKIICTACRGHYLYQVPCFKTHIVWPMQIAHLKLLCTKEGGGSCGRAKLWRYNNTPLATRFHCFDAKLKSCMINEPY